MNKFYFKLLGIILITTILITISTLLYIRISLTKEKSTLSHRGYKEFLLYIVKEIGKEPTKKDIEEIANENGLKIMVKDKNFILTSDDSYFMSNKFLNLKKRKAKKFKRILKRTKIIGREKNLYFLNKVLIGIEFNVFDRQYIFIKLPDNNKQKIANYAITSIILFFLLFAGFLVKKSFVDPLNKLETAINSFSKNIYSNDYIDTKGELHNLFKSFNKMKNEVGSHIEEKERLLRDISHDLRSPITRMKVALELMKDSKEKQRILTDVNELSYLVNQILESQNQENVVLETMNSEKLINDYINSHNLPIKVNIKTLESFSFSGNHKYLQRVINNIIDNSYKYADKEKGVTVEAFTKTGFGHFIISDYNSHINEETISQIFKPFFKGDLSRRQDIKSGSGLGLTITKQLIISMGGKIKAYKSKENGLSLDFSLPLEKV